MRNILILRTFILILTFTSFEGARGSNTPPENNPLIYAPQGWRGEFSAANQAYGIVPGQLSGPGADAQRVANLLGFQELLTDACTAFTGANGAGGLSGTAGASVVIPPQRYEIEGGWLNAAQVALTSTSGTVVTTPACNGLRVQGSEYATQIVQYTANIPILLVGGFSQIFDGLSLSYFRPPITGGIWQAAITTPGSGFIAPAVVSFSGGSCASYPDTYVTVASGAVTSINFINGNAGSGCSSAPTVTISGGGCTSLVTATATIGSSGSVAGFTITSGGAGCASTPAFAWGGTTCATTPSAIANVGVAGTVTGITITGIGSGCTNPPTFTISQSGATTASGIAGVFAADQQAEVIQIGIPAASDSVSVKIGSGTAATYTATAADTAQSFASNLAIAIDNDSSITGANQSAVASGPLVIITGPPGVTSATQVAWTITATTGFAVANGAPLAGMAGPHAVEEYAPRYGSFRNVSMYNAGTCIFLPQGITLGSGKNSDYNVTKDNLRCSNFTDRAWDIQCSAGCSGSWWGNLYASAGAIGIRTPANACMDLKEFDELFISEMNCEHARWGAVNSLDGVTGNQSGLVILNTSGNVTIATLHIEGDEPAVDQTGIISTIQSGNTNIGRLTNAWYFLCNGTNPGTPYAEGTCTPNVTAIVTQHYLVRMTGLNNNVTIGGYYEHDGQIVASSSSPSIPVLGVAYAPPSLLNSKLFIGPMTLDSDGPTALVNPTSKITLTNNGSTAAPVNGFVLPTKTAKVLRQLDGADITTLCAVTSGDTGTLCGYASTADLASTITPVQSMTSHTIYAEPVYIPHFVSIDNLQVKVTAAGASNSECRLGLYGNDGTYQPTNLVIDFGLTAATSATGYIATSGELRSVLLLSGGSGYTSAPAVTLTGGGYTTAATVTATIGTGLAVGIVSSLTISSAGSGYTSNPTLSLGTSLGSATATGSIGQLVPAGLYWLASVCDEGSGSAPATLQGVTYQPGLTANSAGAASGVSASTGTITWSSYTLPSTFYSGASPVAGNLPVPAVYYHAIGGQ